MNIQSIQSKILGAKWMLARPAFDSLYTNLTALDKATYGGLKGLIFGDSLKMKALSNEGTHQASQESGDIALVNISGVLMKGVDEEDEALLGLINVDRISHTLDALEADNTVSHIILNFNSPGGETTGIQELGEKIRHIDQHSKPIYAYCDNQMDSAAYWLGSQTRLIGCSPSSGIGNVGVYMLIPDETKKNEKEGLKINAIYSGHFKLMGHAFRSMSEEELAYMQKDVEKQHQLFKDTIKSVRPEAKDEALEGLSFAADKAFELGLADIVCNSLEEFAAAIT